MTRELVLKALHPSVLLGRSPLGFPIPREESFWRSALDSAERIHSAAPFAAVLLRDPELPEDVRKLLDDRLRRERLLQALLDTEAEVALGMLERAKIPTIVLKGMDLGRRFYPERLLRPMADADLLVPETSFAEALRALESEGFHRVGRLTPGRFRVELSRAQSGGAIVELHCRLQRGETRERTRLAWETSIEGAIPGLPASARALHPSVLVPYLIRHSAVQHLLESPVWLNDLHLVLESGAYSSSAEWALLAERLKEQGTCAAGFFVLSLLRADYGTRVPDGLIHDLSRQAGRLRTLLLSGNASKRLSSGFWFRDADRTLPLILFSRLLLRDSVAEAAIYAITRERPC